MPEKQHCKICGGMRAAFRDGRALRCEGCGTPVANCHISDSLLQKISRKLCCPNCRSQYGEEIEPGRYTCKTCDVTYEAPDFDFVRVDPVQNAEKNEAYIAANTIRKLRHGGR